MNWKAFITALISAVIVSFPQNIIGCGPDADPYDYYSSFFHQNLPDPKGYRPFYYTGNIFLFNSDEPVEVSDLLAIEWATYCGATVTREDAKKFINKFAIKDINGLYTGIEKKQSPIIPDSVMHNSMTNYFTNSKNLEALGYLLYARQVEPYVTVNSDQWAIAERDSLKMAKLIKNGQQLYSASASPFIKLRYGYQVVRLAHYSKRYKDAILFYNRYISGNNTYSELQPLSLALKGGALFKTGNTKEAAYLFSKAFSSSIAKRVSNYLGFKWSINSKTERKEYLAFCKTNEEKASMLSLFALGSVGNELAAMKEIYHLNASCEELQVLAVREINKLEEYYFTPMLKKEKGGNTFYYYWGNVPTDSMLAKAGKETRELVTFLQEAGNNSQIKNAGLFETGAAYAAYLMKDYSTAKKCMAEAEKMNLTKKVKDQLRLTQLLVTINENEQIGSEFEASLLPTLKWLEENVKHEKSVKSGFYEIRQWKKIYRDLMSEILAKRYHRQSDFHKEALCIGSADFIESPGTGADYKKGVDFMRHHLAGKDVEKLYSLLTSKQKTKFENFLVTNNSINISNVADFAGTAYLREYDYTNAIAWFKKSPDKKKLIIHKNPFIDLLYDREEQLPNESNFSTNKLAFTEAMLQLNQLAATDKINAARYYYKIANGIYNMTYYGHTWELVQYYRSGSDGYNFPKEASAFLKEYYGCFRAHDYFEKAMNASTDKNFKARCLFMMAKCSQKQVAKPAYSDFNYNWDRLDAAEKVYWTRFKKNKYFLQFSEDYSGTPFYKEVFNSCSFLRDFVRKTN